MKLSSVALPMLLIATPAHAASERAISFDIPEQDLATALNEFGRQAGVQMVFPYDAIAGRRSIALKGRFSRAEALRRLIAGRGVAIS